MMICDIVSNILILSTSSIDQLLKSITFHLLINKNFYFYTVNSYYLLQLSTIKKVQQIKQKYQICQQSIIQKNIYYQMEQTHIVDEDQMYVRFSDDGQTKLVSYKQIQPGFSYRRVHYTHEGQWRNNRVTGQVFADPQYKIDKQELSKLDSKCSKVTLRRLYDLYNQSPKNSKPSFFPKKQSNTKRIKDHTDLPPFSTEIGIFPTQHYKSLFLTQDFVKHGLYQIIINQNGRFQTDVVDDWVPVYRDTLQPIWGMDIDNAWQIILLKFWAKKNGSYYKIKQIPPFQFIQFFTNSNWKYFNLQKQGQKFIQHYKDKIQLGKFVLKTKNTEEITHSGLIPNSAGYEMIDLRQVYNYGQKQFVIVIRSTMINKWCGKLSVLDKQGNQYQRYKYNMAMERDFLINHKDFLNLFSSAYVASKRDKTNYFSDYYLLNIPQNCKNAIYLKFNVMDDGWFDFCVKQFQGNRIYYTNQKSKFRGQYENNDTNRYHDGKRYIKTKIILAKDNSSGRRQSITSYQQYNTPKFDVYEVEYQHGYNKGDAIYLDIVPGIYYLRIKIQKVTQPTKFVVNYSSNSRITMEEVRLPKQTTSEILRSAMCSLIKDQSSYSLSKQTKYEEITFANLYEQIGYGFVGVRMKRNCPYKLLIQIDPQLIKKSGYKLKNQFKKQTEHFSIVIQKGQSTAVVINKINPNAKWPPQGIQIFRQKM